MNSESFFSVFIIPSISLHQFIGDYYSIIFLLLLKPLAAFSFSLSFDNQIYAIIFKS